MVEELKLAIKIDDASIEQSLLKQFANAQKMANKVVLTFNNIDLDDKAIEAKFKEMQKMTGKNPIDLSIDKSSIEMLSAISKQLGNIFDIAKGKSIIDSSATVSEINKITQATKELNKAQTGSENIQSKSFTTKNKTEAYNQLKKYADAFKNYYGNEEVMATNAGAKAGYAYYKAYEEALRKGVAQSKLEKVTIDFDVNSPFRTKENVVERRIEEFKKFQKYGDTDESTLIGEIATLENRLLKFNSAYSQVKANLGDAPITPEITKNIEEYVRWLEIAESRAKDAELFGDYSSEDFNSDKDLANMYLDFAKEGATTENKKYIESLKQEETQAVATAEAEQKLAEAQKETVSNTSNSNGSQIEELKSDITEVKTELGDVKDKISSIESNGFENVREDVEKTKESVKELNSELIEMKSNFSSTPQESNFSSGNTNKNLNNIIDLSSKFNKSLDVTDDKYEKIKQDILSIAESFKYMLSVNKDLDKYNEAYGKTYDAVKRVGLEQNVYWNKIWQGVKSGIKDDNYDDLIEGVYSGSIREDNPITEFNKDVSKLDKVLQALYGKTINYKEVFLNIFNKLRDGAYSYDEALNKIQEDMNNTPSDLFNDMLYDNGLHPSQLKDKSPSLSLVVDNNEVKDKIISFNEQQNIIQSELQETQTQLESTGKSFEAMAYRGVEAEEAIAKASKNYNEATHWSTDEKIARGYGDFVEYGKVSLNNAFEIDGNGSAWDKITNLGNGLDENSKKAIEFSSSIEKVYTELSTLVKFDDQFDRFNPGFALYSTIGGEISKLSKEQKTQDNSESNIITQKIQRLAELRDKYSDLVASYNEFSRDTSHPYGIKTTDELTQYAQNNGYDGAIYKNILDAKHSPIVSGDEYIKTSDVIVSFYDTQVEHLEKITRKGQEYIRENISDLNQTNELLSSEVPTTQQQEKIQNEINDLYIDLDKLDEKMNLDSNNSSVDNTVQSQEKLQSELKETQEQAEKTAQAIEDTTFQTNQIKNTETISAEQFTKIESLFESIKESLSSIKSVLVDVGDGEELSPLLKTIDNINTSIINLNSDVLYQDTEKSFWTQASSAAGQVTKVFNEMKAASGTNPLADMFGKTDLSEVISQLGLIVAKLEEISTTASSFKNVFDNGFNITASVEEIDKLTNRVKELEDELSKVKLNPANVDKSNISSGTKDAFPDSSTDTKSETEGMEQVKKTTEEAVQAKKDFATANKGVQSSIDGSENPLKLEAELMEQIAKSAREATNAKKEFVEANKQVKDSVDGSNNDLNSGNKKGRYAKAVKLSNDDFMSKYDDFLKKGNELASKTNGSILGGNVDVSYDDVNGLAKVSAKIKDVDGNWRIFSAKLDSDLNVFSQSFKIITSNVKNLDRQLNQLNQENQEVSRSFIFEPNTEGFDDIIVKFGILREQAEQITKIVKATKQTADGADISYKATLKNGSSYYLGENSTPQVLNASETIYNSNAIEKAYQEATKVNNALNETNSLLNSLKVPNGFEGSFSTLESEVQRLNSEFGSGKISATEYASSIKKAFSDYKTPIDNRSKDIWNELTTSLNRYATLQKRIANNNALSTDNEEATRLLEHIHELQRNDILPTDKLTASNEKLQQINQTVTDLKAKLKESTLDSLQGSIDKYQKIYDQRSTHSSDFTPSEQYNKNLAELDTAIRDLVEYKDTLKNVGEVTVEQETHLKRLVTACEKASDSFKSLSASEKGASQLAVNKLVQRINKDLDENTNYSKQAKQGLRALRDELESANPRNLKEITSEIINIENAEIRAGHAGRSFIDTLKNSGFHQLAAQIAGMFGFDDLINLGKQAINTIKELDYALVDLKKTTAMNSSELEQFYYNSNDVAKQMGVTTKEIIDQASSWSRLGYNTREAATEMAKLSSQFSLISPGMDTTTAQEGLVSIMKAWDIGYQDVKSQIMDDINALGNNLALNNQDIVDGMERSAAALAAVGTSTKDAYALFSGIQEVLQNSEKSGTSLRSVALRLRSFDESTEEYSSDLANITGELADLTKTAEHAQGVSVFKPGSTTEFKSLVDYFREIAGIWDEMSQKQQNDFLLKAFGRTQAQAGAALIQNFKGVEKALDVMDNAAGSADKEMETAKQSITYKLNALKETWVGTVQELVDRGDIGKLADGLTKLSEGLGFVIDKLGILGSIGLGAGIFSGIKNVGEWNYISKFHSNNIICFIV